MKLRNKKTGEIVEFKLVQVNDKYIEDHEVDFLNGEKLTLKSLADSFNDVNEPLIKDEKIRKAVRAWVDLYGYKFVTHRFYSTTTGYRWSLLARETQEICLPELDGLDESKDYTIDELCG